MHATWMQAHAAIGRTIVERRATPLPRDASAMLHNNLPLALDSTFDMLQALRRDASECWEYASTRV